MSNNFGTTEKAVLGGVGAAATAAIGGLAVNSVSIGGKLRVLAEENESLVAENEKIKNSSNVNLPNDKDGSVKNVLEALSAKCGSSNDEELVKLKTKLEGVLNGESSKEGGVDSSELDNALFKMGKEAGIFKDEDKALTFEEKLKLFKEKVDSMAAEIKKAKANTGTDSAEIDNWNKVNQFLGKYINLFGWFSGCKHFSNLLQWNVGDGKSDLAAKILTCILVAALAASLAWTICTRYASRDYKWSDHKVLFLARDIGLGLLSFLSGPVGLSINTFGYIFEGGARYFCNKVLMGYTPTSLVNTDYVKLANMGDDYTKNADIIKKDLTVNEVKALKSADSNSKFTDLSTQVNDVVVYKFTVVNNP